MKAHLHQFQRGEEHIKETSLKPSQNLSKTYPNCELLEKKICYLLKTLDKLTTGKSNFENVLASQKYVFGKAGLGFYPQSKERRIAKPYSNFTEKQSVKVSFQLVVTCFYCMKKGHSVRYCKFRKSPVPKGMYKWIPRYTVNTKDKSNTEGRKFFKGSNLEI